MRSEELAVLADDLTPVDLGPIHNRARDEVVRKGKETGWRRYLANIGAHSGRRSDVSSQIDDAQSGETQQHQRTGGAVRTVAGRDVAASGKPGRYPLRFKQ
ncbi:hypothetical protein [Thiocystis minor]|uniref:hypothetical protein n=1 Tax=Thiocystis minor TaxID=61597 RepID=UPI00191220F5|nr:hypothetical protein [Thiocystis minor]